MKKILLGAVLASGLAMSGDLRKCSEAIDMQLKYLDLSSDQSGIISNYKMELRRQKTKEDREMWKGLIADVESLRNMFNELGDRWNEVAQKECLGIAHHEHFGYSSKKKN